MKLSLETWLSTLRCVKLPSSRQKRRVEYSFGKGFNPPDVHEIESDFMFKLSVEFIV